MHQATRIRSLVAARGLLARALVVEDPRFFAALEAVMEVLPVSRAWTGIDPEGGPPQPWTTSRRSTISPASHTGMKSTSPSRSSCGTIRSI